MMQAADRTSAPTSRSNSIDAATGGQQVVENHHPLPGRHRIGLNLNRILAIFQRISVGNRLAG